MPGKHGTLLDRCIAVDLEVNPGTDRLFAIAAVRAGAEEAVVCQNRGRLDGALDRLEAAIGDLDHMVGHNILDFDIPHLVARRPRLAKLAERAIDTLWLNPLAFPANPYHHLVKHYQDGRLLAGHVSDPELDARLALEVLENQLEAFAAIEADALMAYHFLATRMETGGGFDAVFRHLRGAAAPVRDDALAAIGRLLERRACALRAQEEMARLKDPRQCWPMAFALGWISVAGGNSVMPPWVRKRLPEAAEIVRRLRDANCGDPGCGWCREHNDPKRALERWFGFAGFREKPADSDGRPLQERIVEEAMQGRSVLGILPTGTGKSVCYQIPALSTFDKTGALAVVISPLVALMADQIEGMRRQGVSSAVTVNGMLSMPERKDALDRVRLGDAAMLLISPEQLRSPSVRSALAQREVGLWVIDEAHCISKWGHDFRPDYRYVGRFIREFSGDRPPAPLMCLTATAKPDVVRDIREHFRERIGADLALLDGGAVRTNLSFEVRQTSRGAKSADLAEVLEQALPAEGASGAIVYCASRGATERVAGFLKGRGHAAAHFHAGLKPDDKREVQDLFREGELRVIAATNAFGMGIDKPDVRLVVHHDMPGSLENYLQEAGRAGRDREPASCVLLFDETDVERQFWLAALSRLARHEIGAILKALRRLRDRTSDHGDVIATPGEIVRAEKDREFGRDTATDDTRVKIAVSWLEEAKLLTREENRVSVFPSSLRVVSVAEAEALLAKASVTGTRRAALLGIVRHLMNAPSDDGVTTDELTGACGMTLGEIAKALADLEALGILRNEVAVTVFVHAAVEDSSKRRLVQAARLETGLIALMREAAPDADDAGALPLHLTETTQALRDAGHEGARPDIVEKLVRGIAGDGRDQQDGGGGSLSVRKANRNTLMVTLRRAWDALERTAELRRLGGEILLEHLLGKLDRQASGKDIQAATTLGDMLAALDGDALLRGEVRETTKLMERALLWMHEQEIVTLGRGLTVFRPAITVNLKPGTKTFAAEDFAPLEDHYRERTIQTHVMAAYAENGLKSIAQAQDLSRDYFELDRDAFLKRWMPGRMAEIQRQTSGPSWKRIVEDLGNPAQQEIVADDREQTSVLVLAGPGSGKTRTLVHRIAYLIRVRREPPESILALAYSRHAAGEIRERLRRLVGDDARRATVCTCHALAMRLVGTSFAGTVAGDDDFRDALRQATRLLAGDGLDGPEAEALRDTLIQGFRWILVDEYQDVGPEEYAFIAAVAGRSQRDPDLRLSLFAVGDDDQNIFAFKGAAVEYIRRFGEDYRAKPAYLVENYRSTRHIVDAANAVIAGASERMKAGRDIAVDAARERDPPGGALAAADPVGRGRVQILQCPPGDAAQGVAAVDELVRLSRLDGDWDWKSAAVMARVWKQLEPVRAYAESLDIPVSLAGESMPSVWRLREMQALVRGIGREPGRMLTISDALEILNGIEQSGWTNLIAEGVAALAREIGQGSMPAPEMTEWLAEWARDTRGEQNGLLLLSAHRAKGLEFDHVIVLDGDWDRSNGPDSDEARRLRYVAMTRARRSLAMIDAGRCALLPPEGEATLRRPVAPDTDALPRTRQRHFVPDMELVDLSWAGRIRNNHTSLRAIAEARIGDPVTLENQSGKWALRSASGQMLGMMSQKFAPDPELTFVRGEIGAIIRWKKSDSDPEFQKIKCRDEWEVALPELVFDMP